MGKKKSLSIKERLFQFKILDDPEAGWPLQALSSKWLLVHWVQQCGAPTTYGVRSWWSRERAWLSACQNDVLLSLQPHKPPSRAFLSAEPCHISLLIPLVRKCDTLQKGSVHSCLSSFSCIQEKVSGEFLSSLIHLHQQHPHIQETCQWPVMSAVASLDYTMLKEISHVSTFVAMYNDIGDLI